MIIGCQKFLRISLVFNAFKLLSKKKSVSTVRGMGSQEIRLCFPDKTLQFSKSVKSKNESETTNSVSAKTISSNKRNWSTIFSSESNEFYIIFGSQSSDPQSHISEQISYLNSCLNLHEIFRSSQPHASFCLGTTNTRLDQKDEDNAGGHIKRILCATVIKSYSDEFETFLDTKSIKNKINVFKLEILPHRNNEITLKHIFSPEEQETLEPTTFWKYGEEDSSSINPVFQNPDLSPVFHDLDKAMTILKQCSYMPEVKELLEIYYRETEKVVPSSPTTLKYPFVVVEGLDAAGKTTLTRSLEKKLRAVKYRTPPPAIEHLRKYFTKLPELVARAYYQIGNYIVSNQISEECKHRPVILDRYWHSTAAYGIAIETSYTDMPPGGHFTYEWPSNLLKPTIVLFLSVTEATRQQRLRGRNSELTFEEINLDKDVYFRKRLHKAYRRMQNPACVEIDANGSLDSVEQQAITALKEHDIDLK